METNIFQAVRALTSIINRTLSGGIVWDKRTTFLYRDGEKLIERRRKPKLGLHRDFGTAARIRDVHKQMAAMREMSKDDPLVAEVRFGVDASSGVHFLYLYRHWEQLYGMTGETLFLCNDLDTLKNNILKWVHPQGRFDFPPPPEVSFCEHDIIHLVDAAIILAMGKSLKRYRWAADNLVGVSAVLLQYAAVIR
jgi:hypothetical protein